MEDQTHRKKERRREYEAIMEELGRICNDDINEYIGLVYREVEGPKEYCATIPISFGSPVCEYKGTYVSRKVAKLVAQCYVFDFSHESWAVPIDATKHLGTVGPYISHSRDFPNLVCQKVGSQMSPPHLVFFAIRDIIVGEDITYEYGDFSPGYFMASWSQSEPNIEFRLCV